ncbi:hypothetical protein [Candidatus Hodgkinia cicadicola]|uniref:hypothetical protein n=1 Tax=Candidatus Hodgkinia cicadicola TaxID=573658 RepID=UPI001788DAFA
MVSRFSDLTTVSGLSLLANKYSISGVDKLCLFNITSSSDNKKNEYYTIQHRRLLIHVCFIGSKWRNKNDKRCAVFVEGWRVYGSH